jgi:hypothetical protein
MPTSKPAKTISKLAAAQALLKPMAEFDALLAKMLSAKERANAQQHLEALRSEGEAGRADQWERLACAMMTLAPELPRFVGQKAMQFSIPDGRYKQQVFALQSGDKGMTHVYCPDVLEDAVEAGLVRGGKAGERPHLVGTGPGALLPIEQVVSESPGEQRVADCVRPMLGWGKKALHITLAPDTADSLIVATQTLCAMAALKWRKAAS